MRYLCTTYTPADGTTTADYAEETAALLITRALGNGFTLTADTDTATITLTRHGRTVTLTPTEPLADWTRAQRREVLALAASTAAPAWKYGRTNVARLLDGGRWLTHQTTMSLINGGYLTEPRSGAPRLTLRAYLTLGTRPSTRPKPARDQALTNALRNVYSQPAPTTA